MEQLFDQVRCFQHSQLSSPLVHHLKKSWGTSRFHSNLPDHNPTCPKNSLCFPLNKHMIAFWLGSILEQRGNSYSSLGSTRGPKYSQAKCFQLGLSHQNTMVLGNTSVDKCLQNLLFLYKQNSLCIFSKVSRTTEQILHSPLIIFL